MIIYSQSGTKPCESAFKKILLAKKFAITFVKDNKYVIKREPTEDYLNEVFKQGLPYCISDGAGTATKKRTAFWNPTVVCKSSNGDWVTFADYKMIPLGEYDQMEDDDVYYTDFKYKTESYKKQQLLPLRKQTINPYAEQLLKCFSKQFTLPYADYDSDQRRWIKSVHRTIARPFYYENCLYIGKRGGWCIDEEMIDVNWDTMESGKTTNKVFGKIESYVTKYINDQKKDILKLESLFNYEDKEYYECEMQSVFVLLFACRMLKDKEKKMTLKNLNEILSFVKTNSKWASKGHCLIEDYFTWHEDELVEQGLLA